MKWQRAKEDGLHYAEDGSVGADAESERKDGDGGKSGRFSEYARGITQVLPQRGHTLPPVGLRVTTQHVSALDLYTRPIS